MAAAMVALAALLAAACESSGPGSGNCLDGTAGSAPGEWSEGGREAELVELWRAGGLREGEGLAFPVTVIPGPGHRAAIPDFRLGEVMMVGPAGRWEGSWTRRGEGPGEVLRPVAASWTEDGRLVALDIQGARVVWLDSAGTASRTAALDPAFTGPVVAGGSLDWAAVSPDGRAYLRPGISPVPDRALAVAVVTSARPGTGVSDTVATDTLATLSAEGRFARTYLPGAPTPTAALAPDGTLLVGATDGRYRIVRLPGGAPSGSAETVVCREAPLLPLTERERGGSGEGGGPGGDEALARAIRDAPAPEVRAPFGRFFTGRAGRVWVQRERGDPFAGSALWGMPGATYDVFSPEGAYLGRVEAPAGARLQAASGDTVWALEFGELDQASVVAYQLRIREGG